MAEPILVQMVQYREEYVSRSLNRKSSGVVKPGVYAGFRLRHLTGTILSIENDGNSYPYSVAVVEREGYSITVRMTDAGEITVPEGSWYVCVEAYYSLGVDGYQRIVLVQSPEDYHVILGKVTSDGTTITSFSYDEREIGLTVGFIEGLIAACKAELESKVSEAESRAYQYTDARIAEVSGGAFQGYLSVPTLTGPSVGVSGASVTFNSTASALLSGATLASFEFTLPDASTQTVAAVNNAASVTFTLAGSTGEVQSVSVAAIDNYGNRSARVSNEITISAGNVAPDISGLTHNIPAEMTVGITKTCNISGAVDPEGEAVTYSLTLPTGMTASKTTGIAENEPFTLTPDVTMVPDVSVNITIIAQDLQGWSTSAVINTMILASQGSSDEVPSVIGTPWQGGYYAGQIRQDDGIYALVVSPKATGENTKQYKTTASADPVAANNTYDGKMITDLLNDSAHPAFQWAKSLSIGGFTDWYIPAADELEILYRNLKPGTTANYTSTHVLHNAINGTNPYSIPEGAGYTSGDPAQTGILAFRAGGAEALTESYYWSSTQYAANTDGAWRQKFINGNQNDYYKDLDYYVRAVRRVLIQSFDELAPTTIGGAYEGGYYAGMMMQDDGIYALVVASKATGENTKQYKTTASDDPVAANNTYDGKMITDLLNDSAHPAFQWAKSLSIGGFTDWYIPAADELEILYRNLKPGTTANYTSTHVLHNAINGTNPNSIPEGASYTSGDPAQTGILAFRAGGAEALTESYYWSSTQYAATTYGAWIQYFGNGHQGSGSKDNGIYVRAVRRVKL